MINTIIFDLSDVLIKGLEGTEFLLHKYQKNISIKHFFVKPLADFFIAKISEDEYFAALIQKYNWTIPIPILKKAVRDNFVEIEGTREIINRLKKRGYKLGLLSIHTKEWVEYCQEKYKYHHLFDALSYSYEDFVVKPDYDSFYKILKKLDSPASESIFIDDNIKNIVAAKELGFKTIHFINPNQLKEELLQNNINL